MEIYDKYLIREGDNTEFPNNRIVYLIHFSVYHYLKLKIRINGKIEGFIIRKFIDETPLVIDESKQYFNVKKNNFGLIKLFINTVFNDIKYTVEPILYYCIRLPLDENGEFPELVHLSAGMELDTSIIKEIRKLLVFREFFCININGYSSLIIGKYKNGNYFILSLNETGIEYKREEFKLNDIVIGTLFRFDTMKDTFYEMIEANEDTFSTNLATRKVRLEKLFKNFPSKYKILLTRCLFRLNSTILQV